MITLLVEHGADKEATNKDGETALHIGARFGRAGAVSVLLEYGANTEARDNDGREFILHVLKD